MVAILNSTQRDTIAAAVTNAEAATRGEIALVVTRRSIGYAGLTLGVAVAVAFVAAVATHLARPGFGVWTILAVQAAALAVALAVLDMTRIVPRFVPARRRHDRVRRLARAQFAEAGLHNTPDRAAVLLLISLDERCVEIVADHGIDAYAAPGEWDAIAARLTAAIPREGLVPALIGAVEACGAILTRHFPTNGPRENRLDDAPREI